MQWLSLHTLYSRQLHSSTILNVVKAMQVAISILGYMHNLLHVYVHVPAVFWQQAFFEVNLGFP